MANPDTIPLVDLKAQYHAIRGDIDAAIGEVVQQTSFIMGPDVASFEADFGDFCNAQHCIGVSSGTAALVLALHACGVGSGDEVITVAHTFIATAEAISTVGAKPVFVDIDLQTYNMDPDALAAAITPATRAVIPVHIYGQPADMTRINAISKAHDLFVIEDAAQAHGATWRDESVGTLADIACFSFYPGKNLGAYGDAGGITTDNAHLASQIRLLRNHGRRDKYIHEQRGFGERLDTIQAAILRAKLQYLRAWIDARRRIAARYDQLLQDQELVLPFVHQHADSAWHLYVIRTQQRDELLAFLKQQGIGAGIHYPLPLHLQPAYADLGYGPGALPVTETVATTCLSLPIYPEMTVQQQDRIVAAVGKFLEGEQNPR